MAYSPRLSAPSKSSKYYYSGNVFYKSGYGMPNCTCYAWGRFYEISGTYPKLSTSNAENWYGHTSDGYKRSKTPQLGAVICWKKGKAGVGSDGAGHVAIVEKILSNGDIVTSNSAWRSTNFYTQTLKKSNNYSIGSAYTFQGFILNPAVSSSSSSTSSSTTSSSKPKKPAKLVVDGSWGKLTTYASQYVMGTVYDGIISNQYTGSKKYLIAISSGTWKFKATGYTGSPLIRAIQKLTGVPEKERDGLFGMSSIKYMQKFLKKNGYYSKSISGKLNKETVIGWQKYLNRRMGY